MMFFQVKIGDVFGDFLEVFLRCFRIIKNSGAPTTKLFDAPSKRLLFSILTISI
nr:MAG TPA: hypothetical protein [Caudoviricetes sp.]